MKERKGQGGGVGQERQRASRNAWQRRARVWKQASGRCRDERAETKGRGGGQSGAKGKRRGEQGGYGRLRKGRKVESGRAVRLGNTVEYARAAEAMERGTLRAHEALQDVEKATERAIGRTHVCMCVTDERQRVKWTDCSVGLLRGHCENREREREKREG